jgi:hypothetical protein
MIRKIIIRQLSTKKPLNKPLNKPKKHMYDIENESWTKNKSRIQSITYNFKPIKTERKKK